MAWMSRAKSGIDTAMLYNERTSCAQSANNPMMLGASIALVVWSFSHVCDQKIVERERKRRKRRKRVKDKQFQAEGREIKWTTWVWKSLRSRGMKEEEMNWKRKDLRPQASSPTSCFFSAFLLRDKDLPPERGDSGSDLRSGALDETERLE